MSKVINSIILFMVFIMAAPAFSQTRFYLPSSGAAEITVAYDASWDATSEADRVRLASKHVYTALTNKTNTYNPAATQQVLNRQYISDPIAAQTISGNVTGQIRGVETHGLVNGFSSILIKLVDVNGANPRILLNITTNATEYTTTLANKNTPSSTALTSQTANNGDRIVIEIGFMRDNRAATATQDFGDNAATDLTLNLQTETNTYNPWVEFSQDIRFPSVTVID